VRGRGLISPPCGGESEISHLAKAKRRLSARFRKRGAYSCLMPHRTTPPKHLVFARRMRADATKAENMLWQALRASQLEGLKFKRQVPLERVIADFVCFEVRLIVEVDGGQHSELVRDVERDRHFAAQGFRTIRFWNDEVERNLDGVCREILVEAGRRSS